LLFVADSRWWLLGRVTLEVCSTDNTDNEIFHEYYKYLWKHFFELASSMQVYTKYMLTIRSVPLRLLLVADNRWWGLLWRVMLEICSTDITYRQWDTWLINIISI
jgi:hypothetical protein